ncbi:platelet-derived growth factor receptor-like protein [Acipenser oxyrinchus oxyrinchus]|uniref:Platelet-derived growth factor receptor-like protein n=1 Tax=Acipenser oxyrinchus oxyrinchus TaxID=40147 RepID=A0AAD8FXV4_ACIOX|nr:platelet-derived growth factor receptor-like protein [Acipenser oxyrinchus oxyrinchus]
MRVRLLFILVVATVFLLDFAQCQKKEKEEPRPAAEKRQKKKAKPPGAKTAKPVVKKTKATPSRPRPDPPLPSPPVLTQVLERGKFQKVGDSLTVQAGDTLELRCKGKPVEWAFPDYLEEEDEGRLRVIQHSKYSSLVLVNSTGADTGEYICYPMYCEDSDCRREYDRAAKTFIFFSDPQELFVPSAEYYEVVQLRTNRPATLPCQVTSPDAMVTLHREFPPEEVKVDGVEISFNLKKGFTIHRPKAHHAGSLFCMASYRDLRQISTKYMLIYVNYPVAPPSPTIRASLHSVHAGQNLQVTCTVLGESEVVIDFTWEYPGQKIGRPPYTQDSTWTLRSGGQTRQQSETVLMVDGVRAVDQGTYTCTASNLAGSTSVSTTVTVLPERTARSRHH